MRRVEIWNVQGDHMIFDHVMLAGPTDGEKYFCIRTELKMDYIPSIDIKRVTVWDDWNPWGRVNKPPKPAQKSRGRNKR